MRRAGERARADGGAPVAGLAESTHDLVALGIVQDLNGSDPFGLGALLHVGLSSPVLTDPFPTDAGGAAFAALSSDSTSASQRPMSSGRGLSS